MDGRRRWRSWETDDGQRRSKHEVLAERVQFLPSQAAGRDGGRAADVAPEAPSYDEEDVPF